MAIYHRGVRGRLRRLDPVRFAKAYKATRAGQAVYLDWLNRGTVSRNWGDAVAPLLVERMAGAKPLNQRDYPVLGKAPVYTTIGSMLGTIKRDRVHVWGTGFIDSKSQLRCRPEKIHAVRGPLTAARLRSFGITEDFATGDPALLTPYFIDPPPSNPAVLGFIPHYRERDLPQVREIEESGQAKIIDICSGIDRVVAEVKGCSAVASGSLHGLVLADSFKKPSTWAALSDRPAGGGFKFRDYLESIGRRQTIPVGVNRPADMSECLDRCDSSAIELDVDAFIEANPFGWRH